MYNFTTISMEYFAEHAIKGLRALYLSFILTSGTTTQFTRAFISFLNFTGLSSRSFSNFIHVIWHLHDFFKTVANNMKGKVHNNGSPSQSCHLLLSYRVWFKWVSSQTYVTDWMGANLCELIVIRVFTLPCVILSSLEGFVPEKRTFLRILACVY